MLREVVEAELRADRERDGYLFPDYDGYCVGNVPDTVRSVLGAPPRRPLPDDVISAAHRDVERVVMVVVDGYGLDAWRRDHAGVEFLRRLTERGRVTPLTSIYLLQRASRAV